MIVINAIVMAYGVVLNFIITVDSNINSGLGAPTLPLSIHGVLKQMQRFTTYVLWKLMIAVTSSSSLGWF
jgi:hypothetical protein